LKGKKLGGTIGVFVGLIQDIIFGNVIGVYGLIYFVIGYLVGLTDEKVFKENLLIPFAFAGAATVVFHLMYYTFMYFLGINVSFMLLFKKIMIIEVIYNSILAVFVYKNIAKLYRQPTMSFRR